MPIAGYETRYKYWQAMEFTGREWLELHNRAESWGLVFLCSPFSLAAARFLQPLVPAWKVASGEISNRPLLEAMVATGKPILLSTGMSKIDEIGDALDFIAARCGHDNYPSLTFQTTSEYPVVPGHVGLNELHELRLFTDNRFVGLSDHSGSIHTGLAATALGADALEVHVCWNKQGFGPDVSSSITVDELKQLVEGVKWINRITNNPVDKDEMAERLKPTRELFTKSAFANDRNAWRLPGWAVQESDIVMKKPGTGLSMEQVIGRTVIRQVSAGQMLSEADFE